ncbi:MAG: type II secretion system protein [Acidimicrobiia bacterium]
MNARRCRGQAGETLVELLITISILGLAVVAILAGLGTAVRLSGTHRTQANAEVIAAGGAESVKKQQYVDCPSSYTANDDVNVPSGWSLSVTSVKNWNGTSFVSNCPSPNQKLQLVTVRAASPNGNSVETVDVVKRGT